MYQIDFKKPESIHFIGIGGISMSGLASILADAGFTVTGSDARQSEMTDRLEAKGVRINIGQRASNIGGHVDAAVFTAAVHPDNPEYAEAVRRGIPLLSRAQLLGQIMKNYRYAVAVAGTHGKTTTTSMIAEVLLAADSDPTISVGGILNSIQGNIRVGKSELFVTEACEYTDSFLSFYPTIEVILNIEADHLDYFKNLESIRRSFRLFAERLPEEGLLVINSEIENCGELIHGLPCRVILYGSGEGSRCRARDIVYDEYARASFEVVEHGEPVGEIQMSVPGEHNVSNALAAIAVCRELGIPMEQIRDGLKNFSGTNRRFEKKGVLGGITIIDDYAHHPQEIRATVSTALKYPHRKLWVVFQPHTYTRTKAFLDEFARTLSQADEVILADIYAARESDNLGISSKDIADKMELLGAKVHYIPSFDDIEKFILKNCVNGDLLITMGAGDVGKVGEKLLSL